jgi:hypothetical protein
MNTAIVHVGAVRASQVGKNETFGVPANLDVPPRDFGIVKLDLARRLASEQGDAAVQLIAHALIDALDNEQRGHGGRPQGG